MPCHIVRSKFKFYLCPLLWDFGQIADSPNLSFHINKEREYFFCRTGRSFSEIIYGKYFVSCKIHIGLPSNPVVKTPGFHCQGARDPWTGSKIPVCQVTSVQVSHSVMSDSLQPRGLQHARPSCPLVTPRVYSNSCPLSRWCHPTVSSSVVPFSSCFQVFPASGSFQVSQFFSSGGQSIRVSASTSVLPVKDWFPLGWTCWISLQSKGFSRVFFNTTVQKYQFFSAQLSL